jgi:DNA ligase-1
MLPYLEIARSLEAVSREERRGAKAERLAALIKPLPAEMLRPTVRLISGRPWPPWEPRELGIGPETLDAVLEEISGRVPSSEERAADPGDRAERMVRGRSQRTLAPSTMDSLHVYESLRQISAQRGPGSLSRRRAILKGLLLAASPLEAKYLARAVLGRTTAGLGPSLISAAIGKAFDVDYSLVKRAYSYLPDLGMVALNARQGDIYDMRLAPSNPARMMSFRRVKDPRELMAGGGPRAYVVRYGGLRVQVHKFNDRVYIYTSQLRNVTRPLRDLAEEVAMAGGEFVMEGELILVRGGRISPRSETVGRINLRERSRGGAMPSLAASDLLYLNGGDLLQRGYEERRGLLAKALKGVEGRPLSSRIFLAEEEVIGDGQRAEEFLRRSLDRGFGGAWIRDLDGLYIPGEMSSGDAEVSRFPAEGNSSSQDQEPHR